MRHLFTMVFILLCSEQAFADRQLTYEDVKKLATEAVENRDFEFTVPRIEFDQTKGTVWFEWGNLLLPYKRPIEYVVTIQAELEVFRQGYGDSIDENLFEPVVARTEDVIKNQMIRIAYDSRITEAERMAKLKNLKNKEGEQYEQTLDQWAMKNGYRQLPAQDLKTAWTVTLRSDPPKAQIKVMHIVRYRAALLEKVDPIPMMAIYPDGAEFRWSGIHVIAASWPDGQSCKPEQRRIENSGVVTAL